jgi:hypothetical protein
MKTGVGEASTMYKAVLMILPTEMKYMFTNAPASNISKVPEPFRSAVENSRQWKWERSQNLLTTRCFPSLFPKDNTQDVSFTIWCGNEDGYQLTDFFGSELAISSYSNFTVAPLT